MNFIRRCFYPIEILPVRELPNDIFSVIYKFLHWIDIIKMKKVSRYFNYDLKEISDQELDLHCRNILECLPRILNIPYFPDLAYSINDFYFKLRDAEDIHRFSWYEYYKKDIFPIFEKIISKNLCKKHVWKDIQKIKITINLFKMIKDHRTLLLIYKKKVYLVM